MTWSKIYRSQFSAFSQSIPVPAFKLESELQSMWEHSLDAPILQASVLPRLWDAIREDRHLQYLPKEPKMNAERVQYLRARLPLAELQEQDDYLRWHPVSEPESSGTIHNEQFD